MTTIRTIVFGLGFATLGAITTIGTQAVAQQGYGPGMGQGYGSSQGYGQHQAMRARGGMMGMLTSLAEDLELSDEQKALGRELRDELRGLMDDHRGARSADREAILELLQAEQVDSKALHAVIDDRIARQAEMQHAVADAAVDFYESLDLEQRAVLLDRAEQAGERMGQRRRSLQDPLAE
jgi:Spy/CpxP family protein refolding chaperone